MGKRKSTQRKDLSSEEQKLKDRIDSCSSADDLEAIANEYIEAKPVLAAGAYRKAILNSPPNAVLYNNLGVAYWNMGNRGEARQMFERAKELSPEDATIIRNFAGALLDHGQQDKARHWFQKAAELKESGRTFLANVDLHGY